MSKGGSIPGLETDQLLDEDIPGIMRPSTLTQTDDEEVKQFLKDIGSDDEDSLRPVKDGDERPDHTPCIWDPPGNLQKKEYQFSHSTKEEIMTRLFRQVWDLLKYLEELNRKPTPWNDEDDILG